MKVSRTALALLLVMSGIASAHAEGFYVGGNLGNPDWHSRVDGVDGDGRGTAGKLYGGYAFTPRFALEAGAMHLGETRDPSGKVDGDGAFIDAVGTWPLAPDWSLLGRAGVAHATFDGPSGDSSGTGLKLGAGVQHDLSSNVALRAEYERYHFRDVFDSKADVGQLSVGVKVAF